MVDAVSSSRQGRPFTVSENFPGCRLSTFADSRSRRGGNCVPWLPQRAASVSIVTTIDSFPPQFPLIRLFLPSHRSSYFLIKAIRPLFWKWSRFESAFCIVGPICTVLPAFVNVLYLPHEQLKILQIHAIGGRGKQKDSFYLLMGCDVLLPSNYWSSSN